MRTESDTYTVVIFFLHLLAGYCADFRPINVIQITKLMIPAKLAMSSGNRRKYNLAPSVRP